MIFTTQLQQESTRERHIITDAFFSHKIKFRTKSV